MFIFNSSLEGNFTISNTNILYICLNWIKRLLIGYFVGVSLDGTIKVWNVKSAKEKLTLKPFASQIEKPVGISGFELLKSDKMLICPEETCYAIVNDVGDQLAKGKVNFS